MAWCTPGESVLKETKVSRSFGRVCAAVFWNSHVTLLTEYAQKNPQMNKSSVTSHTYENQLKKLGAAIRRLQP